MTIPYQSKKILRFGTQIKLSKNVLHDGWGGIPTASRRNKLQQTGMSTVTGSQGLAPVASFRGAQGLDSRYTLKVHVK